MAHGTASSADAIDHLNTQEIQSPGFLPAVPADTFQLPPVAPPSTAVQSREATAGFKVDRVVFQGNTVISTAMLESVASPFVGRLISAAELEELRQRLTRLYIDRGYVNSGVLLAREPSDDTVFFQVVEGRLSNVRVRGTERLDPEYVSRRLSRESDGPLNIDVVRERFQLLLADPLFDRMNARLLPGLNPGEAILDVDTVRSRPYQATVFFNNYRPTSIGSEAVGTSGLIRNLTGQGDVLELNIQDSLEQGSGTRGGFAWRVPVNYYGTQIYLAWDHGRSSVVQEPLRALNIRSTLDSQTFGASQLLLETLQQKLTFGLDYVNRQNQSVLLGQPFSFTPGEPSGVTREHLWRFWQEYSYRTEKQVMVVRSTLTSGQNNLEQSFAVPALNIIPRDYKIWLGQAQYARQVLDNGAQVIARATVQSTPDNLVPLDAMSIGGVYTVRGYLENQLIRDRGEIYNLEFEYPITRKSADGPNYAIAPFYDYGRGRNNGDMTTTLSSWGLANRLRWRGFSLDIAIGKKLQHPAYIQNTGGSLQDKGIHFQTSYTY